MKNELSGTTSEETDDLNDNEIFEEVCAMLACPTDFREGENHDQRSKVATNMALLPLPPIQRKRIKKRIFKRSDNDPRRTYIHTIAHFMNSADVVGFQGWMEQFFTADIVFTERFVHYVPEYDLYSEYHGINQLIALFGATLEAIPDLITKVHSSHLSLRQDGSSYVVACLTLQGTHTRRILMTDPLHELSSFVDRWNPFSYLYGLVAGAKNPPLSDRESKHSSEAIVVTDESSLHSDSNPSTISNNTMLPCASGKSNNCSSIERIPVDQVKVARASSSVVAGENKDPSIYYIDCTYVLYMNPNDRVYRIEVMKRLVPQQLRSNPFDASQDREWFGDDDSSQDAVEN